MSIGLIFLVVALIFFILAGLDVALPPRMNPTGWGLVFLTLSLMVPVFNLR